MPGCRDGETRSVGQRGMTEGMAYVLLTAAKDEAYYIGQTIESVLRQTVLPVRWVIVDDGSSDGTASVVERVGRSQPWVTLLRLPPRKNRGFGSKARAIGAAYGILGNVEFSYVGNLDADVTLPPDYYSTMVECLRADPRLGVVGGALKDVIGIRRLAQDPSPDSVAGPVQFFRRECFEQVGGYLPLQYGGVDAAAEITARLHGWKVRTVVAVSALHHRPVGSYSDGPLTAAIHRGRTFWSLRYTGLFEVARTFRRLRTRPFVLGAVAELLGYVWYRLRGIGTGLPDPVVRYLRREQRRKLLSVPSRRASP